MYRKLPKLSRDQFWDELDVDLPYTAVSATFKTDKPYMGSTVSMKSGEEVT